MMTEAPKQPARTKRPPAAQGSRIVATGAAVGVGLALIGGMASAAEATPSSQPARVVIVVDGAPALQPVTNVDSETRRTPPRPVAMAETVQQQEPVTESGGS